MDLTYFKKRDGLLKQQEEKIKIVQDRIRECQIDNSQISNDFTNFAESSNKNPIIVYVTLGKVNSGKSKLSETLASRGDVIESRVTSIPNNNDDGIYVYKCNNEKNSFIVDTGGGLTHNNYKTCINELPDKIKSKISEKYSFDETNESSDYIFVFLLLINCEMLNPLSTEEKHILNLLIRGNQKWLICFTKFGEYMNDLGSKNKNIAEHKNLHLKTKFEPFAAGQKQDKLLSKTFFLEFNDEKGEYSEFSGLRKRMNQVANNLDDFDNKLNELLKETFINIGVFGKNNVGKSLITNAILGKDIAEVTTNISSVKKRVFVHPTFENIKIIDHEGYSDKTASIDDEDYAVIILVLDSRGCDESDKNLIKGILREKLFIVQTRLDKNNEIKNDVTKFKEIKEKTKENNCKYLDLSTEDRNYYYVSLNKEYIKEKKINDLDIFLKDIIEKGLDPSQKDDCLDYTQEINLNLIEKIHRQALSISKGGSAGAFFTNLLPIVGDIYDYIYFKKFIKKNCKKLKLVALNNNDSLKKINERYYFKKFSAQHSNDLNRLNEIKSKYSDFNDSDDVVSRIYNEALEKFKKISKLPDIYFDLKKKNISKKANAGVAVQETTKNAAKAVLIAFLGLFDDIARVMPKVTFALGSAGLIVFGVVGAVVSVALGAFSAYYMSTMTKLIIDILIDDAMFLYLGSNLRKRYNLVLKNEDRVNEKTNNLEGLAKVFFQSSKETALKTNFIYIVIGFKESGKSTLAGNLAEIEQRLFSFGINYYIFDTETNITLNYQEWLCEKLETQIEKSITNNGNNQYTYILVCDSSRSCLGAEENKILLSLIEKKRSWLLCFNKFDKFIQKIKETTNKNQYKTKIDSTQSSNINRDEAKENLLKNCIDNIQNIDTEVILSKIYFTEFPQNDTKVNYNELSCVKIKEVLKYNFLEDLRHLESDENETEYNDFNIEVRNNSRRLEDCNYSVEIINRMKNDVLSKNTSEITSNYFFYLLPMLGISSDFPYFRMFIKKYWRKLQLIKLRERDKTKLNALIHVPTQSLNKISSIHSNVTDSEDIYKNIYIGALNKLSRQYKQFDAYFNLNKNGVTNNGVTNKSFIKQLKNAGEECIKMSKTIDELNFSDIEHIEATVEAIAYSITGKMLSEGVARFSVFYMRLMTKVIFDNLIDNFKNS